MDLEVPEEQNSAQLELSDSPYSRMAGGTEYSWCKTVIGGTGITVLALLFDHRCLLNLVAGRASNGNYSDDVNGDGDADQLVVWRFQAIVDELQWRHPRLRSRLVWIQGRPGLSVSDKPFVKVESSTTFEDGCPMKAVSSNEVGKKSNQRHGDEDWLRSVVEMELRNNIEWKNDGSCVEGQAMFSVRLFLRNGERSRVGELHSLFVLRLHTAVCDRASAATILTEVAKGLSKLASEDLSMKLPTPDEGKLVAIEDRIPRGMADKPFWAHGVDLLGYSLGSRRHALLPFQDHISCERWSEIVRHMLTVENTTKLLQACSKEKTSRLGALTAAGLKATAILKHLGARSEQYAIVTLLDCRSRVDPPLHKSTVGFYNSGILNTYQVNEAMDFWELARQCSNTVAKSLSSRKHFTDMGDVTFLMCQAMDFPQLTPFSSLRTSHMVLFHEALDVDDGQIENMVDVGLLDYVGCSSVHGVGPSIAVFDSIQQGALRSTCVYPAPLHSRAQMCQFLETMMGLIIAAIS